MTLLYGHKRRKEALVAILAALCLALAVTGYAQERRVRALTLQVSATYHKALYEAAELLGGVRLGLEKFMVSSSPAQRQAILNDMARQAEGAQDDLSLLPSDHPALDGAIKFANQVSDYASVLAQQIGGGGQLSQEDLSQLQGLHASCVKLLDQLETLAQAYERGELQFPVEQEDLRTAAQSTQDTQPLVSYPVLLYDGPFSDGKPEGQVRVPGNPVTQEQAAQALKDFIGAQRVSQVRLVGESQILSECYEFEADTESGVLEAGVTKAGGHVLYILPTSPVDQVNLSQAECIDLGAQFLAAKGYGDMAVSYWRQQDGILTVNYAAQQDGVILYPDLVKLQISMANGLVVGLEAGNYLRNHVSRALPLPLVSEEQAMAQLNGALSVERIRRCVIPLDVGEAQCWEVTARFQGGNRYLIYLDTQTGQERSILQVVEQEDGILTQ